MKSNKKTHFLCLTIIWVLILLYFSLTPSPPRAISILGWDKLQHAAGLFILSLLISSFYLTLKKSLIKSLTISLIATTLFGIVIELLQSWCTVNRQADIFDVFADALGALLSCILMFSVLYKRDSH